MLIKLMLPVSLIESKAWEEWLHSLDKSYVIPSREQIKKFVVPEMMSTVHSKLKTLLASIPWLNLSADGWSDATMRCFNGYIAQGIDSEWRMHTIPIALRIVKGKIKICKQ